MVHRRDLQYGETVTRVKLFVDRISEWSEVTDLGDLAFLCRIGGLENQDLGIVKRKRKPNVKLIIAPFPDRQRSPEQFFFQPPSQTLLTTGIET